MRPFCKNELLEHGLEKRIFRAAEYGTGHATEDDILMRWRSLTR